MAPPANNSRPSPSSSKLFWSGVVLGMSVLVVFLWSQVVLAQGTNLGLNEFAQNTNLGTNIEIISLIARIINIILGFLGVVAIGLILYAGWLWLTSRGEAEKIAKAKKIMTGAAIGLAIILAAFAIASFIINQIIGSTGGGGGPGVCWDGNPPPCPPPPFGGSYLSVRSQAPQGNGIKLCASVQASFSEAVQWSTVNATNFSIQEAASGTPFTSGTYEPGIDSANIAFTHFGSEFAANTAYRVTLRSGLTGLLSVSNLSLRTDKVWTFTTGNDSDQDPPEVVATQPPEGALEVCRSTPVQVVFSEPMLATSFIDNVHLRKQNGNVILLSEPVFGDGYRIASWQILQTLEPFTTYEVTLDGGPGGITDTCGIPLAEDYTWTFATGETEDCSPSISSVAPDRRDYGQVATITGSNLFLDGEVYVNGFPADSNSFPGATPPENILCYAGLSRDGGVTTCGGSEVKARAPVGATTGPAYDQAGFTETVGEIHLNVAGTNSNELPFTITSPYIEWLSPNSGGLGQFVTISGWNFGSEPGQVRFVRADGTWVEGLPPEVCSDWWQETEIIIKVPDGLVAGVSYQVEIMTAAGGTNGGNKRSNSESFLVTSQPPGPGLCSLEPSSSPILSLPITVTATGERFGNTQGSSVLTFDNANNLNASSYTSWSDSAIVAVTPLIGGENALGEGNWRVQVKVGGVLSNWKRFTVTPDTTIYPQVVESASCSQGTQSPSPYKNSTDACGNAALSARFTVAMDPTTLTVGPSDNIIVEECGQGPSSGACTASLEFNQPTYLYDAQNNVIGFSALPQAGFQADYWYQATITTGVISAEGAALQQPYIWVFQVASDLCSLESVQVTPSYAIIRELTPDPGSQQNFSLAAQAGNCNLINPADYSWRWTAVNHPGDPPPPERIQFLGDGNLLQDGITEVVVEALDWTPSGKPARVTAEAIGENKSDTSDVYVSGTFCTEFTDCNACGPGISRCVAGVCEPVITDLTPPDGAVGTWLTIAGCYFANTRGRVIYPASSGTVDGLWPDPAICGPNTWSNTQIISEVPDKAVTGPVTIERAPPLGGTAVSPAAFTVNNVNRPGLCRLSPLSHYEADLGTPTATLTIDGRGFGSSRLSQLWRWLVGLINKVWAQGLGFPTNTDNVNYYQVEGGNQVYWGSATNYPAWADKQVKAITPVPVGQPLSAVRGLNKVSLNKGNIESNRLNYTIKASNIVYPQVVDYAGCSAATQSPSPYRNTTQACGNAAVSARFTVPMDEATLTIGPNRNITVSECGNGSAIGPCSVSLSFGPPTYLYDSQNKVIGFTAVPGAAFRVGYWYQGTITTAVKSLTGVALQQPYEWSFRVASALCPLTGVLLTPSSATINQLGNQQNFTASATAANCNLINPADYTWRWTAANHPNDPPPPPRIQLAGSPPLGTVATVEALDYTPPGEPARVTAEAVGENKSDTSDVYVTTSAGGGPLPKIISVQPPPGAVNICRNTTLVITFDQNVTSNTIKNGQLILRTNGFGCIATKDSGSWKNWLSRLFNLIRPASADIVHCVAPGNISASGNVITFTPTEALGPNFLYTVQITSPSVDCANSGGLCSNWSFTTGSDICQIQSVTIEPSSHVFTQAGISQDFAAQAWAIDSQPLQANYSWQEQDEADVITITTLPAGSVIAVAANNKNGQALLQVTADGTAYGNAGTAVATAPVTVFLCEVPWIVEDPDYDFRLFYCRGQAGSSNLLPELSVSSVAQPPGDDLLREYFFKHPDLNEAVGLRIYTNPTRLAPKAWYESRGDITKGSPGTIKVDGYQAVRDSQTVYVSALAKFGSNIYTNVYVLSFSQGASAETLAIFNQLVNYWRFNSSLLSEDKAKLQRDLIRLQDMTQLQSILAKYATSHSNTYPTLPAGTFIAGQSTSAWPSWQAELGNTLGQALPLDPINTFVSCPPGFDPNTCWNPATKHFLCLPGSHVYQYQATNDGSGYVLSASPEMIGVTWQGQPTVILPPTAESCGYFSFSSGSG